MLRPRYNLVPRPFPSEEQTRSRCQLALYELVELLEQTRGRARAVVVRRVLRGLGYEERHVDAALAYHLRSGRIFVLGSNLFVAPGFR